MRRAIVRRPPAGGSLGTFGRDFSWIPQPIPLMYERNF